MSFGASGTQMFPWRKMNLLSSQNLWSFSSQAVLGSVWCLSDSVAALELFTFVA